MLSALAACTGAPVDESKVHWIPEDSRRIVLNGPFQGRPAQQVRFQDRWQQEDYALYENGKQRAEIIAIATAPGQLALDYPLTTKLTLPTWAFNGGGVSDLQKARPLPGWSRHMFYRPYRLAAKDRACVSFSGSWDVAQDDPEQRPRRAAFGYYCAAPGVPLDDDRIGTVLGGLRISGFRESAPPSDLSDRAGALSFARGLDANTAGGNPGFPRQFARSYVVTNGKLR